MYINNINTIRQHVTFGDWLFPLSTVLWRFIQVVTYINSSFLLLLSNRFAHRFTTVLVCLTIHQLKDNGVVSSLWIKLLLIKLLWTFVYRFSCEQKSSFLWDKCPEYNDISGIVLAHLAFNRNCQTPSRVSVPFYISTINVWMIYFHYIFLSMCYSH